MILFSTSAALLQRGTTADHSPVGDVLERRCDTSKLYTPRREATLHRSAGSGRTQPFPANVNRHGIRSQIYVKMHRLSNADDMLRR